MRGDDRSSIFRFVQRRYSDNISLVLFVKIKNWKDYVNYGVYLFLSSKKIYPIFFSILGIAKSRQYLSHLRFHRCWRQLECCSCNWLPWISPWTCSKMFGWPETAHTYSSLRLSVFQQRNTIFLKTDIGIEIQYSSLVRYFLFLVQWEILIRKILIVLFQNISRTHYNWTQVHHKNE